MDPIHKALHYRKTQPARSSGLPVVYIGSIALATSGTTNAFIRYGNAHVAALIQNSRHRNGADGIG